MKKLFRVFLVLVVIAAIVYINRYSDEVQDILSNIKFSNVGELINKNGSGDMMTGDMMSGDMMTGETMSGTETAMPSSETTTTSSSDVTIVGDTAVTVTDDSATVVVGDDKPTSDNR